MIEEVDLVGGLDNEDAGGLPPTKDKHPSANNVSYVNTYLFVYTYPPL